MSGLTDYYGIPLNAGDLVLNIDIRLIMEFVGPLVGGSDPFDKDCAVRTLGDHSMTRRGEACTLINFNAQLKDCKLTCLGRISSDDVRDIRPGDYVICRNDLVVRKVKSVVVHSERVICDDGNLYAYFYKFTKQHRWNVENYPENYV